MKKTILKTLLLLASVAAWTSCGSDDDGGTGGIGGEGGKTATTGDFVFCARAESTTEYILQTASLNADVNISSNILELPVSDFTWLYKDDVALGFVYGFQYAGIGYGLRQNSDKTLSDLGQFSITTRYTSYGFVGDYLITTTANQMSSDGTRTDGNVFGFWRANSNGVSLEKSPVIWTRDLCGDGQQATFCGFADLGDGTFLTSMIKSKYNVNGLNMGATIGELLSPDSCWVVQFDTDLNVRRVYGTDKMSYSGGSFHSQNFTQLFKADDGYVYVFSSAYAKYISTSSAKGTLPAACMRIKPGEDDFDSGYYWNIEAALDGYTFRRLWYLEGTKFLAEIYNTKNVTSTAVGHDFRIIDVGSQTVTPVSGLPAKTRITSGTETGGVPMYYNHRVYLPITEAGQSAALYEIDPSTAEATKRMTINGATEIRAVGHLTSK